MTPVGWVILLVETVAAVALGFHGAPTQFRQDQGRAVSAHGAVVILCVIAAAVSQTAPWWAPTGVLVIAGLLGWMVGHVRTSVSWRDER